MKFVWIILCVCLLLPFSGVAKVGPDGKAVVEKLPVSVGELAFFKEFLRAVEKGDLTKMRELALNEGAIKRTYVLMFSQELAEAKGEKEKAAIQKRLDEKDGHSEIFKDMTRKFERCIRLSKNGGLDWAKIKSVMILFERDFKLEDGFPRYDYHFVVRDEKDKPYAFQVQFYRNDQGWHLTEFKYLPEKKSFSRIRKFSTVLPLLSETTLKKSKALLKMLSKSDKEIEKLIVPDKKAMAEIWRLKRRKPLPAEKIKAANEQFISSLKKGFAESKAQLKKENLDITKAKYMYIYDMESELESGFEIYKMYFYARFPSAKEDGKRGVFRIDYAYVDKKWVLFRAQFRGRQKQRWFYNSKLIYPKPNMTKTFRVDKTKFSKIYPAVWFSPSTGEITSLKTKSEIPPEKKYEIWIEPNDPEFGWNPDQKPKDVGFVLIGKGEEVFKNPVLPKDRKIRFKLKITKLMKKTQGAEKLVFYCKAKNSTCVIMVTAMDKKKSIIEFTWRRIEKLE